MAAASTAMQAVPIAHAREIPALDHAEAGRLASAEYERLLACLESLSGEDWSQPTDCTLWNVQQMTAHLAGACAGNASWAAFKRQYVSNPYMRQEACAIDAINRVQVEERADKRPQELIEEFRQIAPQATRVRQNLPWLLRHMYLPLGVLGLCQLHYLTDTIYTRDQWMHRADISRATGRPMQLSAEHDGRIVALVIRDLEQILRPKIGQRRMILRLSGPVSLMYRFGQDATPTSEISMDLLEFNRFASGRINADTARAGAQTTGDAEAVDWFFANCQVPY